MKYIIQLKSVFSLYEYCIPVTAQWVTALPTGTWWRRDTLFRQSNVWWLKQRTRNTEIWRFYDYCSVRKGLCDTSIDFVF